MLASLLRPAAPLGTWEGRLGLVGSAFVPPLHKTILEQSGVNLSVEASTLASPGEKIGDKWVWEALCDGF